MGNVHNQACQEGSACWLPLLKGVLKCLLSACSGMLPGYVSGFYSHEDCHVDLNRLARYADARLILQPATGLDMQVCSQAC